VVEDSAHYGGGGEALVHPAVRDCKRYSNALGVKAVTRECLDELAGGDVITKDVIVAVLYKVEFIVSGTIIIGDIFTCVGVEVALINRSIRVYGVAHTINIISGSANLACHSGKCLSGIVYAPEYLFVFPVVGDRCIQGYCNRNKQYTGDSQRDKKLD